MKQPADDIILPLKSQNFYSKTYKNNSGRFGVPLPLSALLMMTADGKDGSVMLKN